MNPPLTVSALVYLLFYNIYIPFFSHLYNLEIADRENWLFFQIFCLQFYNILLLYLLS